MVLPDDSPRGAAPWPPPHPSPPLPPPREYGAPGTSPSRAPYVVAAAVVAVLAVVALVLVLVQQGGDDGKGATAQDEGSAESDATSAAESAPPTATPVAAFSCWNGAGAASLDECSAPAGEGGLRWLFPVMAQAKCGQPSAQGGDGVVVRVLCLYRLTDGTRAQLGFYEWVSLEKGIAFYDGQGLTRSDPGELLTWNGVTGETAKYATQYAAAPFSVTVTYPAAGTVSPEDQTALAPRPAADFRGVPAQ